MQTENSKKSIVAENFGDEILRIHKKQNPEFEEQLEPQTPEENSIIFNDTVGMEPSFKLEPKEVKISEKAPTEKAESEAEGE